MSVVPDEFLHYLETPLFAHLGTVRPDGSPQVNPMWFSWDGEFIRFTTTTKRQKYRNVQHDKRVSISILDPDDPYLYLEVRGEVVDIQPDPEGTFYVELSERYSDPRPAPPDSPTRVIITVRPTAAHGK